MPPPPENDIDSVIKAPVPADGFHLKMKHMDVWPGFGSSVDPSRVDRTQDALRKKVETSFSFGDSHSAVKKLFAEADTDRNGTLGEDEFVAIMVGKLNFSGYDHYIHQLYPFMQLTGFTIGMTLTCEPSSRDSMLITRVNLIWTNSLPCCSMRLEVVLLRPLERLEVC